jgi:hypothetical protein
MSRGLVLRQSRPASGHTRSEPIPAGFLFLLLAASCGITAGHARRPEQICERRNPLDEAYYSPVALRAGTHEK